MQDKKDIGFISEEIGGMLALKEQYNEEQLRFVKNLVNPDLTDIELFSFLNFCTHVQMNPFNGEIIPVVYNKDDKDKRKVNIIATRNGKRVKGLGKVKNLKVEPIYIKEVSLLDQDKKPTGEKAKIQVDPWEGTLWGAEASCMRDEQLFSVRVPLSEYRGNQYTVWGTKPETMIKKVAESQVLSMAVPELLGGVMDESEMSQETKQRIENGDEKATEKQLETLKVLGADMQKSYTKQEALDEIVRLSDNVKKQKRENTQVEEQL